MKVIFSRKGFDSASGGTASPILPDKRLFSIPIPDNRSSISYQQIHYDELEVGKLVEDLTNGRWQHNHFAHLDPDLDPNSLSRTTGWKPLFGQSGSAQAHLHNQGVNAGDLFLFFGWFRQVEEIYGKFRFVKGAPDLNVLFGWMQVDCALSIENERSKIPSWAADHPHISYRERAKNTLYIATDQLQILSQKFNLPGGGCFPKYHPSLCLTHPGKKRSIWLLPHWFYPKNQQTCLSYHRDLNRWQRIESGVVLQSAYRGQEFILDTDHYPEALDWIVKLFESCGEV